MNLDSEDNISSDHPANAYNHSIIITNDTDHIDRLSQCYDFTKSNDKFHMRILLVNSLIKYMSVYNV